MSSGASPPPGDPFQGDGGFIDPPTPPRQEGHELQQQHLAHNGPSRVDHNVPYEVAPPSKAAPVLHDGASSATQAPPARQVVPPRRTDHTYHDYATQSPSPYEFPVTKKSTSNFPAKLHRMISDPANSHAIQWQPHGRGKLLMFCCQSYS